MYIGIYTHADFAVDRVHSVDQSWELELTLLTRLRVDAVDGVDAVNGVES